MERQLFIENPDGWFRLGRGKSLQFFATDEEVQQWLNEALPSEYAPYFLVSTDLVKEGKDYVQSPFQCDIADFLKCQREKAAKRRINFWIWSKILTPDLSLRHGTWVTAALSLNGLVHLQHGSIFAPQKGADPAHTLYRDVSSIGLVHRVQHVETGEIRVYEDYLRVFEKLRRRIKKSLVYSSIMSIDGQKEELTDFPLMTEGAARSHETGVPFIYAPGQRIRK